MLQRFTRLQHSINVKKVRDTEKLNTLVTKGSTKTFNDLLIGPWKFVPELTMKLILVINLPSHLFQCFGILRMALES